jgi:hypothetical protein
MYLESIPVKDKDLSTKTKVNEQKKLVNKYAKKQYQSDNKHNSQAVAFGKG